MDKKIELGTVRGNIYFFAVVTVIITSPWWWIALSGLFGVPEWVRGLGLALSRIIAITTPVFLGIAPFIAQYLVTTPKKRFMIPFLPHFVAVEPGRALATVTLGGSIARLFLRYTGNVLSTDSEKMLDVVLEKDTKTATQNIHNIWESYVHYWSGLFFPGVYPFRQVYYYPIAPAEIKTDSAGKEKLIVKDEELTDHVRVQEFPWGMLVTVPMKGNLRITFVIGLQLRCRNPKKMLFDIRNWSTSLQQTLRGKIIAVLQTRSPEQFKEEMGACIDEIMRINTEDPKLIEKWGLEILNMWFSGVLYEKGELTDAERESLTALEVADRKSKGRRKEYEVEAEGEALVVAKRAQAIAESPGGRAASQDQALETASGKGATVIVNLGDRSGGTGRSDDEIIKAAAAAFMRASKGDQS